MSPRDSANDVSPSDLTSDFAARVLVRQVAIGVGSTVSVMLLAPWILMLDSVSLAAVWSRIAITGAVGLLVGILFGRHELRTVRPVFLALSLEPDRIESVHVGRLADVPLALTWRFVSPLVLASAALALPGVRLSDGRIALLAIGMHAAAALVHYVVVRDVTIHVIEFAAFEAIAGWLEEESLRAPPTRRIVRKMFVAIVIPVALVVLGSVLVVRSHLRASVARQRVALAIDVARASVEAREGGGWRSGTAEAIAASASRGLALSIVPGTLPRPEPHVARRDQDFVEVRVPIEGRSSHHVLVRYRADAQESGSGEAVLVALGAVLIAAVGGGALGGAFARDLLRTSRQVSLLSTASVIAGEASVGGTGRFRLVSDVSATVDRLSDRFREFAEAQRRAVQSKVAAQRMKQLLFASVSHDLKSPLNAVIGFCEIVRASPLADEQRESLNVIEQRGRELLALIETILDAARVEAGQLKLQTAAVSADQMLEHALAKAFDLTGGRTGEVSVEFAPDMPRLKADPLRGAGALAVLLAHAIEAARDVPDGVVRIRVAAPSGVNALPRIDIEHASSRSRPTLLSMQLEGRSPSETARGVALRLSLARAIVELHGGRVEVGRGARGEAIVSCAWPAA